MITKRVCQNLAVNGGPGSNYKVSDRSMRTDSSVADYDLEESVSFSTGP